MNTKVKIAVTAIPGPESGRTMRPRICSQPSPSRRAASSMSRGSREEAPQEPDGEGQPESDVDDDHPDVRVYQAQRWYIR